MKALPYIQKDTTNETSESIRQQGIRRSTQGYIQSHRQAFSCTRPDLFYGSNHHFISRVLHIRSRHMDELITNLRLLARSREVKASIDAQWKALNARVKKVKKYTILKADRARYAQHVMEVGACALDLQAFNFRIIFFDQYVRIFGCCR